MGKSKASSRPGTKATGQTTLERTDGKVSKPDSGSGSSRLASRITRHDLLIALALLALGLLVYWPVHRFEFVHYDDGEYVSENVRVQAGLTAQNFAWAFRTFFFDNWHPLTWLSYMFDYQLFGLKPGAFHLVNLLFHGLNSVLLFRVLKEMTGARWPSALVAAFFAVHPLHVESVAWVSERKDVLSAFFGFLTLWAYERYARGRSSAASRSPNAGTETPASDSRHSMLNYFLALIFFALGLMAKPMVVTLPFVLLLLDFWPLRRSEFEVQGSRFKVPARLLLEKIPFFALTVVSCVLTYRAQTEALVPASVRPPSARIANVLVSYGRYLGKTIWPRDLAVYYPYPARWSAFAIAASVVVLLALTALAVALRQKRSYLLVGWLWFLGTLVPVVGLVQVGGQAMADRYMYLPIIGLLLMAVWGGRAVGRIPLCKRLRLVPIFGAAGLLACLAIGRLQVRHWANSVTLFEHTLAVTSGSTVAHDNLAAALVGRGQTNEALAHLSAALALDPRDPFAYGSRGTILLGQGKADEAVASFQQGLQIMPNNPVLNHNLGIGLSEQKRFAEALPCFFAALRVRPDWANVHLGLGNALVSLGRVDEAIAQYNEVLRIKPDFAAAHFNLAHALNEQGRFNEAASHFARSFSSQPANADAHCDLAVALSRQGKNQEALAHFNEALRLNPQKAEFHFQFASFLFAQNRTTDALPRYREAVRLDSNFVPALNDLAFILAAHEDPKIRDGTEAVRLAERACDLTGRRQSTFLATLAAAYAEAGQFPKAVEAAQRAFDLAQASGQKDLAASNQKLLETYRAGKPYRLGNP